MHYLKKVKNKNSCLNKFHKIFLKLEKKLKISLKNQSYNQKLKTLNSEYSKGDFLLFLSMNEIHFKGKVAKRPSYLKKPK